MQLNSNKLSLCSEKCHWDSAGHYQQTFFGHKILEFWALRARAMTPAVQLLTVMAGYLPIPYIHSRKYTWGKLLCCGLDHHWWWWFISQKLIPSAISAHSRYGGITGPIAQNFHRHNIEPNVTATLAKAHLTMNEIDAIAISNRPGLRLSLTIGLRYARHLALRYSKPIIPVHHMQAHALTARIEHPIAYPFLCLLISGGHCILTFVKNVDEFLILGETHDNAPGQCFDMVARELQLQHLPQFAGCSGGVAIERAASAALNPDRFDFTLPMMHERSCRFSFSGLQTKARRHIAAVREQEKLTSTQVMQHYEDLCAGYLHMMTAHLAQRTQRAIEYCNQQGWWSAETGRRFVMSGGVACNDFIYSGLQHMCARLDCQIYRPSKRLCTDNGIMIAWNGMERWMANSEAYATTDIDSIEMLTKQPIGEDISANVIRAHIKCQRTDIPLAHSKHWNVSVFFFRFSERIKSHNIRVFLNMLSVCYRNETIDIGIRNHA